MTAHLIKYIKIKYILPITISILLLLQIYIIFLNNLKSDKNFDLSSSLDNFETILYNKNGNNVIKAEKLIYINSSETILKGQSSLTNEEYEISSKDIVINFDTGDAKSNNETYFINKEMEVASDGFEYQSSNKMIKFFENTKILFK